MGARNESVRRVQELRRSNAATARPSGKHLSRAARERAARREQRDT